MNNKTKNTITAIAILIILLAVFVFGYKTYPRLNPPPHTTSEIIYVRDTIPHIIIDTMPWYDYIPDTIIYQDTNFTNIDTGKILRDHFALHVYNRPWEDSLIQISLKDTITQNRPLGSTLTYKILRPQEITYNTTNTYNYSKYLYVGIDIPVRNIEYADFGLFYAFSRGYTGIGYSPALKSISIKGGFRVAKFQ